MQIPEALASKFGSQILAVRKNSPQILFGAGIASGVTSTVLACKATLKLETKLADAQAELTKVREVVEIIEETDSDSVVITDKDGNEQDYSLQDAKKDLAIVYTKRAISVARLYAPAIGFGIVSVALLTKSQHILHERNAGLAAAYTALDNAFRGYRSRVVAEHGEDKDREYFYGHEEVEEINPETNRKRKVTKAAGPSLYATVFSNETSSSWEQNPHHNLNFLKANEQYANHVLQSRGHLFLNEVYKSLGLPNTQAGAVVGWIKGEGDDYVDFNISGEKRMEIIDHFTDTDGAIILDFNVQGLMWDRIEEQQHG